MHCAVEEQWRGDAEPADEQAVEEERLLPVGSYGDGGGVAVLEPVGVHLAPVGAGVVFHAGIRESYDMGVGV